MYLFFLGALAGRVLVYKNLDQLGTGRALMGMEKLKKHWRKLGGTLRSLCAVQPHKKSVVLRFPLSLCICIYMASINTKPIFLRNYSSTVAKVQRKFI
jgi:hypothetical protein